MPLTDAPRVFVEENEFRYKIRDVNAYLNPTDEVSQSFERLRLQNQNDMFELPGSAQALDLNSYEIVVNDSQINTNLGYDASVDLRKSKIKAKFINEKKMYLSYFDVASDIIELKFNEAANYLSRINFEKISLEFTEENSILFSLFFKNNKKIYLEIFVNSTNDDEIIYGFYKDKNVIENGIGSLGDVVTKIQSIATDN